jgi:hypothetical protein
MTPHGYNSASLHDCQEVTRGPRGRAASRWRRAGQYGSIENEPAAIDAGECQEKCAENGDGECYGILGEGLGLSDRSGGREVLGRLRTGFQAEVSPECRTGLLTGRRTGGRRAGLTPTSQEKSRANCPGNCRDCPAEVLAGVSTRVFGELRCDVCAGTGRGGDGGGTDQGRFEILDWRLQIHNRVRSSQKPKAKRQMPKPQERSGQSQICAADEAKSASVGQR